MKKNSIIKLELRIRLKDKVTKSGKSEYISMSRRKLREISSYDVYKIILSEISYTSVSK